MSLLNALDLAAALDRETRDADGASPVARIKTELGTRSRLPLVALAIVLGGLLLIVAITISAGAFSDNFAAGGDAELSARTFRPWFRITLLTGVGVMLIGIIAMLLAIIARIWWFSFSNRTYLPVIVDARRRAAGRSPKFLTTKEDE